MASETDRSAPSIQAANSTDDSTVALANTEMCSPAVPKVRTANVTSVVLQALIALLMVGLLAAMVLVKLVADMALTAAPEFSGIYWPLLLAAWAVLLVGEVFLFALLRLVSLARGTAIFARPALPWVRVLFVCSLLAAAVLLVMLFLVPGPPPLGMLICAGIMPCLTLALTIRVMHHLLEQAIAFRTELSEVI